MKTILLHENYILKTLFLNIILMAGILPSGIRNFINISPARLTSVLNFLEDIYSSIRQHFRSHLFSSYLRSRWLDNSDKHLNKSTNHFLQLLATNS